MREGDKVSKVCSIIKIIFVTKLVKNFFLFFFKEERDTIKQYPIRSMESSKWG